MTQRSLFGGPPAARAQTSQAAAESIRAVAGTQRAAVLEFLRSCGARGATDAEICHALALSPDSGRARRCELRDRGEIRDSGETRPSPSGRAMIVWVVAAAGVVRGEPPRRPGPGANHAGDPDWERGIDWSLLPLPNHHALAENSTKPAADGR